jgi:hypothetical protein
MPLTDSQLVGLMELLLAQQKEIALLKSGTLAMIRIAEEAGLQDVQSRFQRYTSDHIKSAMLDADLAILKQIEQAILQLKHRADPVN